MRLVDFYTNVVKSLGLHVEDGFIYTSDSDDRILVEEAGVPVVIPEKEHMNSLIDRESNEVVKIPFNPLQEDLLTKGESTSAKKVRLGIKLRLTSTILGVSKLLLELASDPEKQKKTKYELQKFLASLSEASEGKKIKHEVDEMSIKNWMKIVDHFNRKDSVELIKIFNTKAGEINGEKFNRVITIHSPLLDILSDEKTTKETEINGVTLRPKDIVVFRLLLKFVLTELNEDNVLKLGNNDEHRPIFMGMMQMYLVLISRINKLANLLSFVDPIESKEAHTELFVELEELEHLNKFNGMVKTIPSDKALHKQAVETDDEELSLSGLTKSNAKKSSVLDNILSKREEVEEREERVPRSRERVEREEPSIVDSILGRSPSREPERNSRYSPERVYDAAPEYRYRDRERESSGWSGSSKPRLSERLEAKYSRRTNSDRYSRSLDHRPSGRSRFN